MPSNDADDLPTISSGPAVTRRDFVSTAMVGATAFAFGDRRLAFIPLDDRDAVFAQITAQHDSTVKQLQQWIALPSIAAENRGYPEGPEYMARLAREAGFQHVEVVPTSGKAGVFATLDAGARTWLAIYFMYDVKQYDPAEWSSPPLEAPIARAWAR
jgi:hypothetical protein